MVKPASHQQHHGKYGPLIKLKSQVQIKGIHIAQKDKHAYEVTHPAAQHPLSHQFLKFLSPHQDPCKGFEHEPYRKCGIVRKDLHQRAPRGPGMFLHCKGIAENIKKQRDQGTCHISQIPHVPGPDI